MQIGTWSSALGLNVTASSRLRAELGGVASLSVVTILEPPYVMVRCPDCSGNSRYEGFAIDLLNSISEVGY